MAALLLEPPAGGAVGRSYMVTPSPCGTRWALLLFQDGEPMGGGTYQRSDDGTGFDAGYQDALETGEAWL